MQTATPWSPNKAAIRKVKNPLSAPQHCPYCFGKVEIINNSAIYGKSYGAWPWVYRCAGSCNAYVGMHPYTDIPLGTLANEELRRARKCCKEPFERLWQSGMMSRSAAYEALARHLDIPVAACHFGWFNVAKCEQAKQWALSVLNGFRRNLQ